MPTAVLIAAPTPGGSRSVAAQCSQWRRALTSFGFTLSAPDTPDTPDTPEMKGTSPDLLVIESTPPTSPTDVSAFDWSGVTERSAVVVRHHDVNESLITHDRARDQRVTHIATTQRLRRELAARGIAATTVPYTFSFEPPIDTAQRRADLRAALGIDADTVLLLQPTKAAEHENVAGSVRYLQQLSTMIPAHRLRLWITGPVDSTFQSVFDRLIERCPVETLTRTVDDVDDAYAASDAVLLPTARERFPSVVCEAVRHAKPVVVGPFATLGELDACGIKTFSLDEPTELVKFLAQRATTLHDVNRRRAEMSFGIETHDRALRSVLDSMGFI